MEQGPNVVAAATVTVYTDDAESEEQELVENSEGEGAEEPESEEEEEEEEQPDDYERQRLRNIQQNQEMLMKLGLLGGNKLFAPQTPKRSYKPREKKTADTPIRSSDRLQRKVSPPITVHFLLVYKIFGGIKVAWQRSHFFSCFCCRSQEGPMLKTPFSRTLPRHSKRKRKRKRR